MNYEDRLRHRDLTDRATRLRERLEADKGAAPLRGEDGRELVALVEETLALISPERWDRVMEMIVDEAARRSGAPSLFD